MKPLLPSAALILGCIAAASAQAQKPSGADFWSRAAGDAPKPKAAAPAPVPLPVPLPVPVPAKPPASAPADVYAAFGMTGTWAPDCAGPASRDNPRFTYTVGADGRLTGIGRFGNGAPLGTEVREAEIDAAGRLRTVTVSRFEDLPEGQRTELGKDGARPSVTVVTTFAKGADGGIAPVESEFTVGGGPSKFTIVDGYRFDTRTQAKGARVPARFRCPDAPAAGAAVVLVAPTIAAPPAYAPPTIAALGGDGLVAEGVRYGVGRLTLTAPRVELRGTGLSREDLARLLDPAAPGDLRARLTAVKAREIVVPELRIAAGSAQDGTAQDGTATDGTATLRDIRLSDLGEGRIGAAAVGSGTGAFGAGGKPGKAEFARFEASAVDLGHLLGLLGFGPAEAGAAARPVFAGTALEGLTVTGPDGDVARIARIAARDYRARPTADGLGAVFARVTAALDKNGPPGAEGPALAAVADLLGAFEIGGVELVGLEVQGREKGSARIARIGLAAASGMPGSFRLDGFEGAIPDGTVRIAGFSLDDVSLRSLIDGMASVARSGAAIGPAEARRLVPQVGAIRLGRVEVAEAGAAPVSVDGVEIATSDLLDGLPTRMRFALRNLSVPWAAVSSQDATGQLAGLGYRDLVTSVRADLGWSEAGRELAVHEIAVEGTGIGTATLRAVIGNVPRALFSPDAETTMRVALGATAQSLDLDIQDRGLLDRILSTQAKQRGVTAEDLRIEVASYARLGIPMALGAMAGGTELGQAVARFVARPGRLAIRARAIRPEGVSAAEIADAADPAALLGRFTVTAVTD